MLLATNVMNTSIALSWTSAGYEVCYNLTWLRNTTCNEEGEAGLSLPCMIDSNGANVSETITGLEEDSTYQITVTAFNRDGVSEDSNTVTEMTLAASEQRYYV